MSIAVTGATGQLGSLVIADLLDRGISPAQVAAVVRDPDKATSLRERGVEVRVADYTDPVSLRTAFEGVDTLMFVSGSELGQRIAQHRNVIEAARTASVGLIAYTSVLAADTSRLAVAPEHRATEAMLAESSVPNVVLRNGWYWENYSATIAQAAQSGTLYGAAGQGRLAAATRADYAAAAAAVLTQDGHAGKVYELGGNERPTYAEFAAAIGEVAGRPVRYQDLEPAEYAATLRQSGLPDPVADMLADTDAAIARGELDTTSGDLARLLGRESTPVAEVIRTAIG
ncbi:SDR family oxidoreductase [Nocardia sp. NPDC050378]|uniref:SDR family oxidoreductase n=1 Tax=Nocardia sp. NPDC050378 TaxID=3155400 RepID=UPI0033C3E85E